MLTNRSHYLSRVSWSSVPLICLIAYVALLAFGKASGIGLYGIPGVLLLFYIPGRLAMDLYPSLQKPWGVVGRLALAVFLSVSFITTMQIFLNRFGLTERTTILPVLAVNLVLCSATIIKNWLHRFDAIQEVSKDIYIIKGLRDLWPLFIVLGVLCMVILINPYPADVDGFLTALQRSVVCQCVSIDFRQLFVSYQVLIHLVLGVPLTVIFRAFFPALFFISTGFTFDYALRHIQIRHMAHIAYLALLIAPAVISEVNIVRPQVAMLAYTLPVLIIAIEAWRTSSLLYVAISLWFSLVAIGFHEISIVLFLVALISFVPTIWKHGITDRRITWKQVAVVILVVLPYLKLLSIHQYFAKLISNVQLAIKIFPPVHWRWWFLNSYISIDGFNLGWPGIQAVYFYAYNGLLLLGFVLLLLAWVAMKRNRLRSIIIIPAIYAVLFLIMAELLPRLGFFFLPMRAWVHLMLALSVMVLVIYETGFKTSRLVRFFGVQLPIFLIIVGVAGAIYVAGNNVTEMFREEIPSITFIKSTPEKSLFISSQDNHTLVQFYGQRTYINILVKEKLDRNQFDQIIDRQLDASKRAQVTHVPEVREETKRFQDGKFISDVTKVLNPARDIVVKPLYESGSPVYFLYSIRKSSGVNSRRAYSNILNDQANKDTYSNIDYPISYHDTAVVILKLR